MKRIGERIKRHAGSAVAFPFLAFTVLFFSYAAAAQDTQVKYQRKSITYVNTVLMTGFGAHLSAEQESCLLRALKREIEMSRFDYNPLPEGILEKFKLAVGPRRAWDLDGVAVAMNDVLTPEILRVVDYEKEMRALGLVDEVARHSFIVEKAKETGVTAEDLEAIMNSAYVYLPVISHLSFHEYTPLAILDLLLGNKSKRRRIRADLDGAILWFAVKAEPDSSHVALLAKKEASASGSAESGTGDSHNYNVADAQQKAFAEAADLLALNLKIATQEIPDFRLANALTNTGSGWVEFPLGAKEGLGKDDKFIIAEYYEQSSGSLQQKKLGLVRVSQVADNWEKQADSRARAVMGGGFQPGMVAIEHPRMPFDLSFRFALLPYRVSSGDVVLEGETHLGLDQAATGYVYAGQLGMNHSLAKLTDISQFFFAYNGEVGTTHLSGFRAFDNDYSVTALYLGASGGFVKKYHLNRVHLGLEALASLAYFRFAGSVSNGTQDASAEWSQLNVGATLNANLEIALGYDLNLGGGASYRLFAPSDYWQYKYDHDEKDLSEDPERPALNLSGLGFHIYATWSLPALGWKVF